MIDEQINNSKKNTLDEQKSSGKINELDEQAGYGRIDNLDEQAMRMFDTYVDEQMEQMIISNSSKPEAISKIKVRPILLKGQVLYQATQYCGQQVMHSNYTKEELILKLSEWLSGLMKQVELRHKLAVVTMLFSKKGKATIKCKKQENVVLLPIGAHNRAKQYILEEGTNIPFMIDLGIMTTEGKIVQAKYDKYRQINRFLEFIEDILPAFDQTIGSSEELAKADGRTKEFTKSDTTSREIRILDFGCGKSYLTFAMYYYLHELKGYPVRITGLDLKKDVVADCAELAVRYGYERLEFLHGDIADYTGDTAVDMVVSLHACDTATDYALQRAVKWNAKVILSVPCCQHELNGQMGSTTLNPLMKHGILKERMSALITDAFRAELLECYGYKVQVLEFIDLEHTPKNLLIRAVKKTGKSAEIQMKRLEDCYQSMESLGVQPKLYELLQNEQ